MAYLDRMGREGVRELVSDGEVATPEQLAERRARLDELRRQNAPILRPVMAESDVSNEAELRDTLRHAIAERSVADAEHAKAATALARGREVHGRAVEDMTAAASEVDRLGKDLAARLAQWASGEGAEPEPEAGSDPDAYARHVASQARAASAEQAVQTLAATEAARKTRAADASLRVQQAVHRVVAREAEVIARRVEAMRAEADALANGIAQIGAHFGPNAMGGAVHHTATARLAGGSFVSPRIVGLESAANRQMREAWGAFVQALTTDADARLALPDLVSGDLEPPVPPTVAA